MSSGSTGCGSSVARTLDRVRFALSLIIAAGARRGGGTMAPKICSRADAEREIEIADEFGARFVALGEANYPRRLQAIDDAPPLIAVRGNCAALALPAVAMVGSRNASAAGLKITERIARGIGDAGFAV